MTAGERSLGGRDVRAPARALIGLATIAFVLAACGGPDGALSSAEEPAPRAAAAGEPAAATATIDDPGSGSDPVAIEVPADDPTMPVIGSPLVDRGRPPWIAEDGTLDRSLMPPFLPVAARGVVVGYVATQALHAPPAELGGQSSVSILDASGRVIGRLGDDGTPDLNP